jgi:argininosuccinate synthase
LETVICVEWLTAWREGASAARAGAVARGEEEGSETARGTSACVQHRRASMPDAARELAVRVVFHVLKARFLENGWANTYF